MMNHVASDPVSTGRSASCSHGVGPSVWWMELGEWGFWGSVAWHAWIVLSGRTTRSAETFVGVVSGLLLSIRWKDLKIVSLSGHKAAWGTFG